MRHHLVRHAHAGTRGTWPGSDLERPLDPLGDKQAAAIADDVMRRASDPTALRLWTSEAARCVGTLEPLARRVERNVKVTGVLLEGTDPTAALAWLVARKRPTVACSHGDVIEGLLDLLDAAGVNLGPKVSAPKASTWELVVEHGRVVRGVRRRPPVV